MRKLILNLALIAVIGSGAAARSQTTAAPRVGSSNAVMTCQVVTAPSTLSTNDNVNFLRCDPTGAVAIANPAEAATVANAVAATATFTTTAQQVMGKTYDLYITFAAIAGTYSTCTLQPESSPDGTHFINEGSAISVSVANGTIEAASASASHGISNEFVFACSGSYGSGGTATVVQVFHP